MHTVLFYSAIQRDAQLKKSRTFDIIVSLFFSFSCSFYGGGRLQWGRSSLCLCDWPRVSYRTACQHSQYPKWIRTYITCGSQERFEFKEAETTDRYVPVNRTELLLYSFEVPSQYWHSPTNRLTVNLGFVSPCIFIHSNELIPTRCSN
jgi:hypothetical protein